MGKKDSTKTDFSSFMCIVLMLTGALITIMVSNVMIIAANPDNIEITSVVTASDAGVGEDKEKLEDAFGNVLKSPTYVEVYRDRMVIYPEAAILGISDLEMKDNAFEKLVKKTQANSEREYIVLLVRPFASAVARQLKKVIVDSKVDIGVDLLDATSPIMLRGSGTNVATAVKG